MPAGRPGSISLSRSARRCPPAAGWRRAPSRTRRTCRRRRRTRRPPRSGWSTGSTRPGRGRPAGGNDRRLAVADQPGERVVGWLLEVRQCGHMKSRYTSTVTGPVPTRDAGGVGRRRRRPGGRAVGPLRLEARTIAGNRPRRRAARRRQRRRVALAAWRRACLLRRAARSAPGRSLLLSSSSSSSPVRISRLSRRRRVRGRNTR